MAPPPRPSAGQRPTAGGKFLWAGDRKLYPRGVTYGAFRPDSSGEEFHDPARISQDFAQMAANGFNAVRIPHTVPPRLLLDIAQEHGLWVMVGLQAEDYVGYLSDRDGAPDVAERIRSRVRSCAGHPALLCYALGNEIPAQTVRWLGPRRVERYLSALYETVKGEDPEGLVTYVNYPSTEYLDLGFLDLLAFNVYLEDPARLESYLARLQNVAGNRPLLMSELGLDSLRNGEWAQAESLDRQLRTAFSSGCAGAFVFAWTDEWYRGDADVDVDDWAFGLTDRARRPKPALAAVRRSFAEVPFPKPASWPRVSVVVCCHNSAATIEECLEGLSHVIYPDFEVIVVDDGSTDTTADIASRYDVRLVRTEQQGLSSARNRGLEEASGEIVAYLDSDASPDPHWLDYLVRAFEESDHAGVGGPNVAPRDGRVAACVARAPGGPIHVLLSDKEAEHIPGCNMAFRKAALEDLGGFDPRFWTAGDDVDICWRLRDGGHTLGFSPAAMVWHRPRDSVRAYWRQQRGYGKAEALLGQKWPEKYDSAGHAHWNGRIYNDGFRLGRPGRIYHGVFGSAPFQSLYERRPTTFGALPLLPEWWLAIAALVLLSALGALWSPLLVSVSLPLLIGAVLAAGVRAALASRGPPLPGRPCPWHKHVALHALTAFLHLIQPLARLSGRLSPGGTPWRSGARSARTVPRRREVAVWRESWREPCAWVEALEARLRASGACVLRGGDFDRWDLSVRGGLFASARVLIAVEEHGNRCQLVRFRIWPRLSSPTIALAAFGAVAAAAALDQAWNAAVVLGALTGMLAFRAGTDAASATGALLHAVEHEGTDAAPPR